MKILIIGERYSSNLGDPVICETVEYLIKKELPLATITHLDLSSREYYVNDSRTIDLVQSGRKSSFKRRVSYKLTNLGIDTEFLKFKRSHEKNLQNFNNFFAEAKYDLAVFAGGQMFKDSFVFPVKTVVEQLKQQNVKVIFNACGVGKIESRKMQEVLKSALISENVISISSRDDVKAVNNLINDHQNKATKTYDPAIWANEVYNVSKKSSDVIGLGIMYAHNMNYKEMVVFWKNTILELEKRKIKWKFFCNGPEKDYEFAKHILRLMDYEEKDLTEFIVERPKKPKELVEIIASFKGIISFRLHSHIVAYSLDIPGIAMVWDAKVSQFYDNINLPDRYFNIGSNITDIIDNLQKNLGHSYNETLRNKQKLLGKKMLVENIKKIVE